MAKDQAITRDELIDVLAVFYHGRLRLEFQNINNSIDNVDGQLSMVEKRLAVVEVELRGVKDNIKGLNAEFSDMPSWKEFKKLERNVDRFNPIS